MGSMELTVHTSDVWRPATHATFDLIFHPHPTYPTRAGTLLLEWTPDRKGVVVRGTQPLPIPPSGLVRRRNDGEWVVVSVRDYMNRSA